jgi:hypothetical protein
MYGIVDWFPPALPALLGFVTYLYLYKKLAPSTIKTYLAGVRSLCVDFGQSIAVFSSPLLERIVRAVKRTSPKSIRRKRLPITIWLLKRIIRSIRVCDQTTRSLVAALAVGFFGLLRGGEFLKKSSRHPILRRADVSWHDDWIIIHLRASKTDPFRIGVDIRIPRLDSDVSPYELTRIAWDSAPDKRLEAPLFQDNAGQPLTYKFFQHQLKLLVAALGIKEAVSSHSLRIGAATTLALLKVPAHTIKAMGRWRSLSYQLYTRISDNQMREASVAMAEAQAMGDGFGGIPVAKLTSMSLDQIDVLVKLVKEK